MLLPSTLAIASMLMPPNRLHEEKLDGGLTRAEFDAAVARVRPYFETLAARQGAPAALLPDWGDGTVNAIAQRFDATWTVRVSGGLARRPEMTPDAFVLALCHEVGHHAGGFVHSPGSTWSSAEGQADYFAAQSCARAIFGNEPPQPLPGVAAGCAFSWPGGPELCERTARAAEALTSLFAAARKIPAPRLNTPDLTWLEVTDTSHPEPQCRLDTFLAGAACPLENPWADVRDAALERNGIEAERRSAEFTCHEGQGRLVGVRPRCWFAPRWEYAGARVLALAPVASREGAFLPGDTVGVQAVLEKGASAGAPHEISAEGPSSLSIAAVSPELEILARDALAWPTGESVFREDLVKISHEARCGETLHTDLTWRVGPAALRRRLAIPVGARETYALPDWNSETPIPDGVRFLDVTHHADLPARAVEAVFEVDFTHAFPGDLIWNLLAPNGKTYELERHRLGAAGRHTRSLRAAIDAPSGPGTWTLQVRDTARGDAGTLHRVRMSLTLGVCPGL